MKDEEVIDIRVEEQVKRQVMNRITQAHVRGLDARKADELGVFDRMSLLLTGMFTLQNVAYRLYGAVEHMLVMLGADNKHDIRVACNSYNFAFDSFLNFWSSFYMKNNTAQKEMNGESEALYHQFMRWAQLPESWGLGEPLRTDDETDTMMEYDEGEGTLALKFYRTLLEHETVGDVRESFMVTRYDRRTKMQEVIEKDLTRGDAQMVAKRLSDNDPERVYAVSQVQEYTERRKDVLPIKAYKANEVISSIRKTIKR